MPISPKPTAEIAIAPSLVRALLEAQHPDLAGLPLQHLGEGWDNALFRLGDDLAVRLPRRAAAARLIQHEQQWLPQFAGRLPLPIPVPVRAGRPGCGFPWFWSVTPWFPGRTALQSPFTDGPSAAVALGEFLRCLHQPAPADAPRNPWRGIPLAARTDILKTHLEEVEALVDRRAVLHLWSQATSSAPWTGPPLWIHGDLHPGNLLVHDGRLCAVLDFGDLTAGDPATDVSVMWMLLPPTARPAFVDSARGDANPIDESTLVRARGWALALGLAFLANADEDAALAALGQATVEAALMETA